MEGHGLKIFGAKKDAPSIPPGGSNMPIHIEYTGFQQRIQLNGRTWIPKIYEGLGVVPAGFNAVLISLDVSEHALLDWQEALQKAQELSAEGLMILWELHFNLVEGSLEDPVQFMTLQLGVQHFVQTIWPLMHASTLGILLYKGECKREIQELLVRYLRLLTALLDEAVTCFVFLDTSKIVDPLVYFRLTDLERWGHLHLGIKGPCVLRYPYAVPALGWGQTQSVLGYCSDQAGELLPERRLKVALCLPREGGDDLIQKALTFLENIPFRIIPEDLLTQEWGGVDKLVVFQACMHAKNLRSLQGFLAAGGDVINSP
jgi:hypothetical protein